MTIREKIIDIALKEVGYSEGENNDNKYGVWFGWNQVEWCGQFCSWVYSLAGISIKKGGFTKGFAGVGTLLANYGKCLTSDPKAGDLVVFDFNVDKKPDHVGIFNEWIIKGSTFSCIEGNTRVGNDASGGRVMVRTRNFYSVQAFLNLIDHA